MFTARYFAPRYFATRYWPKVGATLVAIVADAVTWWWDHRI